MAKKPTVNNSILNKLNETPSKDDFILHHWADYIEIKCFYSPDGVFTKEDFLTCIKENKDFTAKNNGLDLYDDIEGEYEEDNPAFNDKAYKNDKEERFADDCFKVLESRIRIFKQFYPFTQSKEKNAIFREKIFSWRNRCYTFLLFSASLKYAGDQQAILEASFDSFSLHVLKALLPARAEAHIFGASASLLKKQKYNGSTWKKLNQLKTDLKEELIIAKRKDFSGKADNEGTGFHFIAWIPTGDNQSHLISFTGQANCTNLWSDKKYMDSAASLRSLIPVAVPSTSLMFIPYSVRNIDGSWYNPEEIGECVLFDRQRLLSQFDDNEQAYLSLPCDKVIVKLLKVKETIYN